MNEDLFVVKKKINIGEAELTFRVLSDLALQDRDEYAMLAMARRRRELDDPNSNAHELYIKGLEVAPDDELRGIVLLATQTDLQREAIRTIQQAPLPFPDNASDEEKADIVAKREAEPQRVLDEQNAFVTTRIEEFSKSIKDLNHDELVKMAKQKQFEQQARLVSIRAFQDFTVYASVFEDWECTKRYFAKPLQVSELPTEARAAFVIAYFNQVDVISPLDLQRRFMTGDSTDSAPQSSPPEPTPAPSAQKKHRK